MELHTDRLGLGLAVLATLGSLLLAGYLLFTSVTTVPGGSEAATGLESANPTIIALAVVPVILSGAGSVSAYYGRETALLGSGLLLLGAGFLGFNVGLFYIALGLVLICAYLLITV